MVRKQRYMPAVKPKKWRNPLTSFSSKITLAILFSSNKCWHLAPWLSNFTLHGMASRRSKCWLTQTLNWISSSWI